MTAIEQQREVTGPMTRAFFIHEGSISLAQPALPVSLISILLLIGGG